MTQNLIPLLLVGMVAMGLGQEAEKASLPTGPGFDPKAIVGASECTECHTHSAAIWEKTV